MKRLIIAAAALVALASHAIAADVATKAPSGFFNPTYPYQTNGVIFGIYTAGTGGSVTANVPGIPSSSLTTTTAEIGGTIGYAWGQKGSPIAYTVEADFGFTNFNGNNQGLSLQGPLSFEQRFTIMTPFSNLTSLLPNFPNIFGTVPPFAPLQPGATAVGALQSGIAFGVKEKDISSAFAGVASNKVFLIEPIVRLVALQQVSTGGALYAFAETAFRTQGKIVGPVPGSFIDPGTTEVTAGIGYRW
jgi:hypothetical protein